MNTNSHPLRCAIADDEPLPIELLRDYIDRTPGLKLVTASRNPVELIAMLEHQPVDILFLDIQMPELDGFQVANLLRGKCEIVLTTAFPQYALAGYEYDVVDYLLKPFSFERFLGAINKCRKRITAQTKNVPVQVNGQQEPGYFFVKTGSRLMKVHYDDVLYLEAMRDYISIQLPDEKIMTLQSLSSFEEQLPERFIRIHRSYIINADKVSFIEGNKIGIENQVIPVGEKYQSRLSRLSGK
jgi:two-component system LytT family response regulator